jgi:hypothetical protein
MSLVGRWRRSASVRGRRCRVDARAADGVLANRLYGSRDEGRGLGRRQGDDGQLIGGDKK